MRAARTLAYPCMYVPTESIAVKATPVLAAGAVIVLSDVQQALSLQSQSCMCQSHFAQLRGEISVFLPSLHGPWSSAVVSAPPLVMGHPQGSAPEAAVEHTCPPL